MCVRHIRAVYGKDTLHRCTLGMKDEVTRDTDHKNIRRKAERTTALIGGPEPWGGKLVPAPQNTHTRQDKEARATVSGQEEKDQDN